MADALFPVFGTGVAPLLGRQPIMDRLWRELTKPTTSHLQVVGPRYAGKTVLLHALAQRMRQDDSPFRCVVLWDLGHLTPESNADFIAALSERVRGALHQAGSAYADELRDVAPEDAYGTLKEVLEVLADEGLSIFLLLDGFDKPLGSGRLSRNLWDQLRELGSLPNLRFVTASRQPLSRLIRSEESATSDFWNIFDQSPVRVGPFDAADLDAVLACVPVALDAGARTELVNWSGGFPLFVLTLLNEVQARHGDGAVGASDINAATPAASQQIGAAIEALWRDCPVEAQDLAGLLRQQGPTPRTGLVSGHLDWLLERGFAASAGGKVTLGCRFLGEHLGTGATGAAGMARHFGTAEAYAASMRGVLERRLSHLVHIDERSRRRVSRAIEDIPEHPDDCLNNLTHIQEDALDAILRREYGEQRILREGDWDHWHWCDKDNSSVGKLKQYAGRKVPADRWLQCQLLKLLTGSQQKIDARATFATKDMYALVDAIHTFRNRTQHGDREPMDVGVAIAALMLCLELLACIDRAWRREGAGGSDAPEPWAVPGRVWAHPGPPRYPMRILVSWIGQSDLNAAAGVADAGLGPIGQAVTQRAFDRLVLLCNYPQALADGYQTWVGQHTQASVEVRPVKLSRPTHFGEIYQAVTGTVGALLAECGDQAQLTFHLSPGTPAMAAVWIIVSKTRYGAELIESSRQEGVRTAEIPFAISAEYIPQVYRRADRELSRLGAGVSEPAPAFADLVHQGPAMREVIARARRVAPRNVPVLIEGESGTGKEMLARAIHRASPRAERPFVAVNCGAIVRELAESELFGHRKGAFTGASADRAGYFEEASGGTLFLDEIGELGLDLQVKLLRVLQEGQVTRVGTTAAVRVDVRIVAATNRTLAAEVAAGRFRNDLFFRLAVALIRLPPLRERAGDLMLLADHLLGQINRDYACDPGWESKRLSPAAKNRLGRHHWPGNVRELANTLSRAALWSTGGQIDEHDIADALLELPSATPAGDGLLDLSTAAGVDLPDLMRRLASHYLAEAMALTGGNKTKAAKLLGLASHQTLSNWLDKYGPADR